MDTMIQIPSIRSFGRFVAAAVVLAACGSGGRSAGSTGATPSSPELRDVRYCEVLPSVTQGSTVTTSIYNTLGYNACPPV